MMQKRDKKVTCNRLIKGFPLYSEVQESVGTSFLRSWVRRHRQQNKWFICGQSVRGRMAMNALYQCIVDANDQIGQDRSIALRCVVYILRATTTSQLSLSLVLVRSTSLASIPIPMRLRHFIKTMRRSWSKSWSKRVYPCYWCTFLKTNSTNHLSPRPRLRLQPIIPAILFDIRLVVIERD